MKQQINRGKNLLSFLEEGSVPQSSKDKVLNAAVAFCSTDMRPFTAIEGEAFEQVANKVTEIGGSMDL